MKTGCKFELWLWDGYDKCIDYPLAIICIFKQVIFRLDFQTAATYSCGRTSARSQQVLLNYFSSHSNSDCYLTESAAHVAKYRFH